MDLNTPLPPKELPEIQWGSIEFDHMKFMTDLLNDHMPPKSKGEQPAQGQWHEGDAKPEAKAPAKPGPVAAPPAPTKGQKRGEEKKLVPKHSENWLNGLKAVAHLAQQSRAHPLNVAALNQSLTAIKQRTVSRG
jgi:hypothetical protein